MKKKRLAELIYALDPDVLKSKGPYKEMCIKGYRVKRETKQQIRITREIS